MKTPPCFSVVCRHLLLTSVITLCASRAAAQSPEINAFSESGSFPDGFHIVDQTTAVLGTISATQSGAHGFAITTASYGSLTATMHVQADGFPTNGNFLGGSYSAGSVDFGDGQISKNYWSDSVIVDPTVDHVLGSGGTAQVTFSLTGFYTDSGNVSGGSGWALVAGGVAARHLFSTDNAQVSDFSSFTVNFGFQYGMPFSIQAGLQAEGGTNTVFANETVDASLSLRQTGFKVITGGSDNAFTSSSFTGSAGAETVNLGGSYAGFTLHNTSSYGHGSTLSILGGTASANRTLNASFLGQVAGFNQASDIVDVSGVSGDKFVLQLSYDPALATSLLGSEANAMLLWQDPATGSFGNAILGNSDGGTQSQHFVGAYNPATEFVLGDYGVDTVNHVVWAVVDHNSEFAVGQTVPEPGTWVTLASGIGVLALRRRRK